MKKSPPRGGDWIEEKFVEARDLNEDK